ncbi:hypothetical protein [Microseira wollei]|uniref:hypothetical protein n=1 Tax=Microseira wollei TaxID=467598 RepID=UPI001CFD2044|nr:hypothetical protein [Microseira wollei]
MRSLGRAIAQRTVGISGEHVNFVGWVEVRNPTKAGLLGFTYVQPNLHRRANCFPDMLPISLSLQHAIASSSST